MSTTSNYDHFKNLKKQWFSNKNVQGHAHKELHLSRLVMQLNEVQNLKNLQSFLSKNKLQIRYYIGRIRGMEY